MEGYDLHPKVVQNLQQAGVENIFPVQKDVIPILLAQNSQLCVEPQDICVSAPTGSGKTLSYAVPIVNTLLKEQTARLRALVLLPSRELANQVHEVFRQLTKGTHVRVAVATGQTDFEQEQRALMGPFVEDQPVGGNVSVIASHYSNKRLHTFAFDALPGISNVDILVCTSGRLLDHLQLTRGFTLQHLRFLVLDEADRLLGNAYHSWVRSLIHSVTDTSNTYSKLSDSLTYSEKRHCAGIAVDASDPTVGADQVNRYLEMRPPLQRLLFSATLTDNPSKLAMLGIYSPLLIHSASYGPPQSAAAGTEVGVDDAEKAEGDDEDGAGVTAGGDGAKFSLPIGLSESRIICETENRPITLITLILEALQRDGVDKEGANVGIEGEGADKSSKGASKHPHRGLCGEAGSMCIVFTSSVEETHRLCKLLQLMNGQIDASGKGTKAEKSNLKFNGRVEEMSRTVRADERGRIMEACKAGKVTVLVSSDHLARGIDLPNIKLVINYDPPKHVKTYVHRAGRTARAQRKGHCVTILNVGQVGAFRKLRGQVGGAELSQEEFNAVVKKCSVRKATEEGIVDLYKRSIKRLPALLNQ